jgi:Fibronectin type III domain
MAVGHGAGPRAAVVFPMTAAAKRPLRPPTNLVARAGNQLVNLSWTASSSKNVGGYDVYRQNADGTWPTTPIATTSASSTTYVDTGLTNGTTYAYRVTGLDTSTPPNQSAPSNTASATPTAPTSGPCGSATTPPGHLRPRDLDPDGESLLQ